MSAKIFKNNSSEESVSISVPVPDDAEAVRSLGSPSAGGSNTWARPEGELAIDVYVTPSAVVVRTAMAGVRPQDINISLHNDLLTIRGTRLEEEAIEADCYMLQECYWGSFSRSVILPVPVEARGAEAVMKNGILKVILPRVNPSLVSLHIDDLSYE
ncbi:hypothetical protein A3H10_00460 [Candidatus Uhrbacteria bacterium RIFCSPLOWO2_12_FULL_46_10]|uniref:SHSP domain-containing protein n=1 Tax=Candidatus Uhrbacteria bacterium RIFCSPLOWO2_01_FULL_47_25 TaxID=1802402 RepID=A0A1F7UTX7_9BACT|nr:MAG: Protein containing Heat shock protein Hsp20 protein [Parcubacteria group bacterium GW2011_GWA2_46_9]OGL59284.1 MAG: hypothetical protein A2752_01280 [Candidatus Uhrbacteria bacterium RIFCSPHIGHO2_01_FULL_46_23]OGL68471.1 MAG: hypothetical protein A3D60_02535 [Candidatus Uhrbacteria bacterium RIFCSPHIGHO2_02_FULL_47_29]OGL75601.1 MAG: hypothetical protein A3E96_01000 [Candidatus Uhrbacteria bacterium RIFCSPHIGHO2_12_FULL_46_13]OGL81117.1 MAG: hypothetical protein A2936_00765 [Candidatus 